MALPQGIDFRNTSGFVTDPTNCYYSLTPSSITYPITTPQGNTVGWEAGIQGSQDASAYTGTQARVAGINYSLGTGVATYRIDLPATGNYNVRVGAGDATNSFGVYWELFDTTTSLGILVNVHTPAIDHFYDATDTLRTSHSDWDTNNALAGPFTFASTICRLKSAAATTCVIAHFWVEAAGSSGPTGGASELLNHILESASGLVGSLGSGFGQLKVISETATGKIGAKAGGLDTLKPIIESASGTVLTNITASGIDQFRAILEQSTAFAGAKGFALDTLKHLTGSATGQISTNNAVGYGIDQLKPITGSATAKIGAVASATGTFRVLTDTATGKLGALGQSLNSLNAIRSTGFGVSAAPSIQPGPSPFGGFVSYDYQTTTTEPLVPLEPEPEPMDIKAELPVIKHVPFTPDYKPLKQKVSASVAKEMKSFWEEKKQDDELAILEDDEQVVMALSQFFMENRF